MEKPVIITVKGVQTSPDGESEVIELVTQGILTPSNEGFNVAYDETEMTGLEGTRTTFQIAPDCITLMRSGAFNSQMVFQPGRRHLSMYETPYGALSMGVNTRRMHSTLTEVGGEVTIDYAVEMNHGHVGDHSFFITVRPQ